MDSRSAPVEVPPSESATTPFIQNFVGSSSPLIQNSSQHSWSPKIGYYIVRTVDSPREEGLRYEKRHGYAALSLSGPKLSAPERSMKWS